MIEKIDIVEAAGVGNHEILFKNAVEAISEKLNEVIDAVNKLEPRCISHYDGLTEHDKELSRAMGNHHD